MIVSWEIRTLNEAPDSPRSGKETHFHVKLKGSQNCACWRASFVCLHACVRACIRLPLACALQGHTAAAAAAAGDCCCCHDSSAAVSGRAEGEWDAPSSSLHPDSDNGMLDKNDPTPAHRRKQCVCLCVRVCIRVWGLLVPCCSIPSYGLVWHLLAGLAWLKNTPPPHPRPPPGRKQPHIAFIMKGLSCKKGLKKMKDSLLSQSSDL